MHIFTENIENFGSVNHFAVDYVALNTLAGNIGRCNYSDKWAILIICVQNQSGAWYAEAVYRAVIRKLEKIKTLQGFKKFSGWRSRRSKFAMGNARNVL